MKLTPEEEAIHKSWEATANDGFIRPDAPGSRGRLTPEELAIHNREDGIVPIVDETEPPVARDRREMVEANSQVPGETPMEGEAGAQGWVFGGGVPAGMQFVFRRADGAPQGVMTCPCDFDETGYPIYTLELKRNADGRVTKITIDLEHHQQYSNVFSPEQHGIPLPKQLRGQLTAEGKAMAQRLVEAGAMKQDASKPTMPVKPIAGFRPKKPV